MTQEEFEKVMLFPKADVAPYVESVEDHVMVGDVNWVTAGAVAAVKDQGACGSCWAFGAAGTAEAVNFINGGSLTTFSEQQLTSCDRSGFNQACNGGSAHWALGFWASNGICTMASYPYTSGGGSVAACQQNSCTKASFTV